MNDTSGSPACGWQPLVGLRVLDFSLLLPGPFATVTLADLGAEVIKIEPLGGDFARRMAGPMFAMANRNKQILALDLKNPATRPLIERLARCADLVVEGFRPGVAARLMVDHPCLSALNPRLIYCSISGYGQDGPARDAPGHDLNYIAASGGLMFAGHWNGAPRRSGMPVADLAGASFAIVAMLAALHERGRTGKGVYLDLALAIIEPQFWQRFVAATADIAPDFAAPAWAEESGRLTDGDALHARIAAVMRTQSSDEWLQRLARHDVPAQLVLSPAEAARAPQTRARELVMEHEGQRHLPFPVRADHRRGARFDRVAGAVGADADAVLIDLGLTAVEIDALRTSGALAPAPR